MHNGNHVYKVVVELWREGCDVLHIHMVSSCVDTYTYLVDLYDLYPYAYWQTHKQDRGGRWREGCAALQIHIVSLYADTYTYMIYIYDVYLYV